LKVFPENIKFKYNWRKYQQRALDELESHLDDNHLHIVAPPGSGKTVLGLEVALRLNKPTLIISPTIAIRNQWVQRFCELFLQVETQPDWISNDIKKPKFLTIVTYQSIYAACSINSDTNPDEDIEDENPETSRNSTSKIDTSEIIRLLKAQKIGTIIADEAHHLKNEWWKSLIAISDEIKPTIVALTATPPYDVSYSEWQRYLEFNGPIDTEIATPELVSEGDLCPHQDLLYFSEPTFEENKLLVEYKIQIEKLVLEIQNDKTFTQALLNHPFYALPKQNLEKLYTNIDQYISLIIFLNSAGIEITKTHREIIGDKNLIIPPLTYECLEILLTFYLFTDTENFSAYSKHKTNLLNLLKHNNAFERNSVCLTQNQKVTNSLNSSISKLNSISEIVDLEYNSLKSDLRMVILTDYIRKEYLVAENESNIPLIKMGVVPIFEKLRRNNIKGLKIGVLTGSLIIIPKTALKFAQVLASKRNITDLSYSVLNYDNQYLIINMQEQIKNHIVQIVTRLFELGEIEVLIGTKSLLGEGWDTPAINSIILASFVGSFVLSNQMRGRAIRSDRDNANKTSNIWHLVCLNTLSEDGGEDFQLLKRRFNSFVGISLSNIVSIENGIDKFVLPYKSFYQADINLLNSYIYKFAVDRTVLREKWKEALVNGRSLIQEIKVPFPSGHNYNQIKKLQYNKTIGYLFATLGSGLFVTMAKVIIEQMPNAIRRIKSTEDLYKFLTFIGVLVTILFGRQLLMTFKLYVKYRDISKDIHQIGITLLNTLVYGKIITTNISNLKIESYVDEYGTIYCHLNGGTNHEKSVFIKSLREIISPINNPRYVIIRKSIFLNTITQKDYHSVPEIIGQNKKLTQFFREQWLQFVGACELIYTRTIEGHKFMLKSRMNSLSAQLDNHSEVINKWR